MPLDTGPLIDVEPGRCLACVVMANTYLLRAGLGRAKR